MMKSAVTALLMFAAMTSCAAAAPQAAPRFVPLPGRPVVQVDWQYPDFLPPRFRNHCSVDTFSGRPYCSNHCGSEYQFYYCSEISFGCCRLGRGYCDFRGRARCYP